MSDFAGPVAWSCMALAAAMAVAGCQRAGNPITEAAIEHATRGHDGGAAGSTPGGPDGGAARALSGDSLPLPAHFPADVYLPRDYRVNSVMDLQDVSVLSLSAPGKVASLFTDARGAMLAKGWTQTLAAQHSIDTAMLAFEKDTGTGHRSTTLSFNRNNGDERVIVGVQLRAPMVQ
ncbi:MAG TPA: hypothetical protein PK743_07375 [Luteimonas sp.]|nr:hypothetical protein [Luteimonas sp.]HRO27247.1 hypothetical protein [Luteimonas sp.]HRP72438.1 hypothetical protein [Luteimonas sp.]